MDPVALIMSLLSGAAQIPVVGKYVAIVVSVVMLLPAVVSALVAIWHGLVQLIQGLAAVPGLAALQTLADQMKADSQVIDDDSNKILSILDRLSSIPLPQAPVSASLQGPKAK